MYHGVLLIDKPTGMSSFDVIRNVRQSLSTRKIGHTGTLDPMASGVLVLCLGDATKLVQYLTADDKSYHGQVTLGQATNTYDAEGESTATNTWEEMQHIQVESIQSACQSLTGPIQQVPPIYSAIKINGERAYNKARRGEDITLQAREVIIHHLHSQDWQWQEEENRISFQIDVTCSKGTYIRSLAVDLARQLSVHGHLSALKRTACGHFQLSQCYTLDSITPEKIHQQLISIKSALSHWPSISVNQEQNQQLKYGNRLMSQDFQSLDGVQDNQLICACNEQEQVVAIMQKMPDLSLRIVKGFHHSTQS